MEYTLSEHADITIRERKIDREWIERALTSPGRTAPDRDDPTATHVMIVIPENGNRVLRVIYNHTKNPIHLITVYFDRTQKGKL